MRTESSGTRRIADSPLDMTRGVEPCTETAGVGATSEELLAAVANGDERAFALLYDRVAPMVLGTVSSVVRDPAQSEEVTQEVFVHLWRTAARYRPEREGALTWLLTMAHRQAVDRVRSAEARTCRERAATACNSGDQPYQEVLERVLANAEQKQARECLQALTDLERGSIVLAYYEARTCLEVAQAYDVAVGTVKSQLRSGLLRLRACLSSDPTS